jgi:phosphoglycerol transferase MdoB-like AlkP superfamily enzyme
MTQRFGWASIVARVLFSFFVVFAVYNPSGHSYWHWIQQGSAGFWTKMAVGIGLLVLHIFIVSTTVSVMKWRGVLLIVALLFSGWMAVSNQAGLGHGGAFSTVVIAMTGLALLYAAGLSYSHIHHRIAGVTHVEKVN